MTVAWLGVISLIITLFLFINDLLKFEEGKCNSGIDRLIMEKSDVLLSKYDADSKLVETATLNEIWESKYGRRLSSVNLPKTLLNSIAAKENQIITATDTIKREKLKCQSYTFQLKWLIYFILGLIISAIFLACKVLKKSRR